MKPGLYFETSKDLETRERFECDVYRRNELPLDVDLAMALLEQNRFEGERFIQVVFFRRAGMPYIVRWHHPESWADFEVAAKIMIAEAIEELGAEVGG